jgi:RimJ/RimL family protein N-acetyltransferase
VGPIETERLVLRSPEPGELDVIYTTLVREIEDESFTREAFDDEMQFDARLASQPLGESFGRPAVFLRSTDRYIGFCVFMPRLCRRTEGTAAGETPGAPSQLNTIEAEIGWAISDQHRRQGYAAEAGRALIRYGFDELRLPRVVAFTEPHNSASLAVMRKLGMRVDLRPGGADAVGRVEREPPRRV